MGLNTPRFGPLLEKHLSDTGMSQSDLARESGSNQSFISQVIRGVRKPPLKMLETWATALRITGAARKRFIELGHLENATPIVQAMVARLEDRLEQQDAGKLPT